MAKTQENGATEQASAPVGVLVKANPAERPVNVAMPVNLGEVATVKPNVGSLSEEQFATLLSQYVKTAELNMTQARTLSEDALRHFEKHGDVIRLQRLHDAMPKNFHRRRALILWAAAFSPLEVSNGRFVKDKKPGANPFNIQAAMNEPFWDFTPEPVVSELHGGAVLVELTKAVDKLRKRADDDGVRLLNSVELAVRQLQHSNIDASITH